MAQNFRPSSSQTDVRVFIQDSAGRFLSRGDDCWYLGTDRASAVVLHYVADRVAEQLEALRKNQGIALEAVPVPLEEIYEYCDGCHELFAPVMIFFDGSRFLCPDCRTRFLRRGKG